MERKFQIPDATEIMKSYRGSGDDMVSVKLTIKELRDLISFYRAQARENRKTAEEWRSQNQGCTSTDGFPSEVDQLVMGAIYMETRAAELIPADPLRATKWLTPKTDER